MNTSNINIMLNILALILGGGMLAAVLKYRQGMQGLSNTDRADIRDHYAEELERVIERQRECEQREMDLRRRVMELEEKLAGMARQFVAFQLETAKTIPPARWTPPMREALRSLSEIAGISFE